MIKLSFCLPVYNQIDLVRECIGSILDYKGDDIEIIINDDCSADDIKSVVNSYGDERIVYFRNAENLGHDLNIISGMRKARAPFVFLLRTRDRVVANAIPVMIQKIYEFPVSYASFSSYDENNKPRIRYKNDKIYKSTFKKLLMDSVLYTHPSGSIYKVDSKQLDDIQNELIKENSKYSFLMHVMLRTALCESGSIGVFSDYSWIYTNTENSKDVAENSKSTKDSVYSYELQMARLGTLLSWDKKTITRGQKIAIALLLRKYLKQVTWISKRRYENGSLRQHYNYDYIKINIRDERHRFWRDVSKIMNNMGMKFGLRLNILCLVWNIENVTVEPLKYYFIWR